MKSSSFKICCVIVSYNSPEELKKCIESCLTQVNKIIVVDNSTESDAINDVTSIGYSELVDVIINNQNLGLGAALNRGIICSLEHDYDWTLLLDQDSVLSANMVSEMLASYEKLNFSDKLKTEVIVPIIYDPRLKKNYPPIITTGLLNHKIKSPEEDLFIHFQITSGSLVKNEVFRNIGLMNELFFIDYIDYDFCFRVLNNNYKILLSKSAMIHHSLAKVNSKSYYCFLEHNPLRVFYQTRNRLVLMRKYGSRYKSFFYAEGCRFFLKWIKIFLLESNKMDKYKAIIRGIRQFIKDYHTLTGSTENIVEQLKN